jgi:hypothetical protein
LFADRTYINLRRVLFLCECGWTNDQLVADDD